MRSTAAPPIRECPFRGERTQGSAWASQRQRPATTHDLSRHQQKRTLGSRWHNTMSVEPLPFGSPWSVLRCSLREADDGRVLAVKSRGTASSSLWASGGECDRGPSLRDNSNVRGRAYVVADDRLRV